VSSGVYFGRRCYLVKPPGLPHKWRVPDYVIKHVGRISLPDLYLDLAVKSEDAGRLAGDPDDRQH
jgi:hypothetical protein